jgi:hypothetical protein
MGVWKLEDGQVTEADCVMEGRRGRKCRLQAVLYGIWENKHHIKPLDRA